MAVELVEDTAASVTFWPTTGAARPSSATLSVRDPGGTEKEAPSVSVVTTSATVSAVASQVSCTVSSGAIFVPGEPVWLVCADGWEGPVVVDEIAGTTLTLESAPPGTLDTASVFYGLKCSATIAATTPATRGKHWRLEWTVTDADSNVATYQQVAHVVRMKFRDPVTSTEAKRYVASSFPGLAASKTAGWFRGLASRANRRVRDLLRASGDYPHLVGDHDALTDAGLVALRLVMSEESITPGDWDRQSYQETQRRALNDAIAAALANTWVDRDDDKGVGGDDLRGLYTIRVGRA